MSFRGSGGIETPGTFASFGYKRRYKKSMKGCRVAKRHRAAAKRGNRIRWFHCRTARIRSHCSVKPNHFRLTLSDTVSVSAKMPPELLLLLVTKEEINTLVAQKYITICKKTQRCITLSLCNASLQQLFIIFCSLLLPALSFFCA